MSKYCYRTWKSGFVEGWRIILQFVLQCSKVDELDLSAGKEKKGNMCTRHCQVEYGTIREYFAAIQNQ